MLHVSNQHYGLCRVSGSRYNAPLRFALPDAWNHMTTDHLGRLLLSCECVSQPFDLSGDLGHPVQDSGGGALTKTYVGYPPVGVSRGRISALNSWSTYLMNIKATFTDWNFSQGTLSFHERPVSHYNLKGYLTSDPDEVTFFRTGSPYYENAAYPLFAGTYTEGNGINFHSPGYGYLPIAGLWKLLPLIQSEVDDGVWDFYNDSIHYQYSSLKYREVDLFVSEVSYKVVIEQWSGGVFHRKTVRVRLDLHVERHGGYYPSGSPFTLSSVVTFLLRYQTCVTAEAHGVDPSSYLGLTEESVPSLTSDWADYPGYGFTELALDVYATHPHNIQIRTDELVGWDGEQYIAGEDRCFRAFRATTLPILQDVYAACFVSTKNAVDAHLEVMKSNHLEAILEVGDFVRLVDLVVALRCLRSRKHVFKALLSLLADAKLTYSFGIAPSISDAKDVAKRATAFMRKYTTSMLYKWWQLHGSYQMDVPDYLAGEFTGGLKLVARSRVEVAVNPDSYLATLMPVDAMGLLPTFSAIWDIIPFSFLVDYLLPVGDYLDDVDHQIMFLALEQQPSVHSVSLEYEFPDELCALHGVHKIVGASGLTGYKYYDRFALSGLPTLGPTRLPIHGLISVPDWGTIGSLLYKFFS